MAELVHANQVTEAKRYYSKHTKHLWPSLEIGWSRSWRLNFSIDLDVYDTEFTPYTSIGIHLNFLRPYIYFDLIVWWKAWDKEDEAS